MAVASKLPSLTASFRSEAEIPPYRFVMPGAGVAPDVAIGSQAWFAQVAQEDNEGVIGASGIRGVPEGGIGEVVTSGIALVECGEDIVQGQAVVSNNDGVAIGFGGSGAEFICGVALTGGKAGSVIAVKLK